MRDCYGGGAVIGRRGIARAIADRTPAGGVCRHRLIGGTGDARFFVIVDGHRKTTFAGIVVLIFHRVRDRRCAHAEVVARASVLRYRTPDGQAANGRWRAGSEGDAERDRGIVVQVGMIQQQRHRAVVVHFVAGVEGCICRAGDGSQRADGIYRVIIRNHRIAANKSISVQCT